MHTQRPKPHVAFGIGHVDVAGPSLAALTPFYEQVFGWTVQPRGPGYAALITPDGSANAALVEQAEPAVTVGVVVPDLAATLALAVGQGGAIAMPATDNGWVRKAQVRDPAGNLWTVIEEDHDQNRKR
jgi:predicted enzyme related to lactoylglutathione lyase